MIHIRPADPDHLHLFPGIANGQGNFNDAGALDTLKRQIETGVAVSLVTEDGEIVCIMGVAKISHGVGDGWFRASPLLRKHLRDVQKAVPRVIAIATVANEFHRVHTLVKTGYTAGRKFVEFLGFEYEATLEKIGPEAGDYDIFIWKGV